MHLRSILSVHISLVWLFCRQQEVLVAICEMSPKFNHQFILHR